MIFGKFLNENTRYTDTKTRRNKILLLLLLFPLSLSLFLSKENWKKVGINLESRESLSGRPPPLLPPLSPEMPVRGSSSVSRGIGATLFNFRASPSTLLRSEKESFFFAVIDAATSFRGFLPAYPPYDLVFISATSTVLPPLPPPLVAPNFPRLRSRNLSTLSLSLPLFLLLFIRRNHREYIWATYRATCLSYYLFEQESP